ncbi:UDP-4-amino-4,6-dideoxy-N-acetyl-beta-L-altrosamine transaminase [Marinobacter sp. es.048]|uniref:UDP-4-amino-4, 6-dideoxy-N-acetyl-beta-L-altrosamine transaminase n=1 Tax=Marinobacter sp. es.048 TaxID=1761795 RepID=UPI000B58CF43|nr:UDP-4-amino-4,6-dideoxy-N-acetyl-beta-L-altrosamine transaminase [Marinobacter sp. es.048]SNC66935.1 UDP-4-amino-4,6-dideoxy-N-acetyl-beta-L-altrosamine transaminase [Marinobacter sp. es.048]
MIPYGRQDITEEDIKAVVEVLTSTHLTQGPAVPKFEQAVIRHCNAKHAVATNSATSALHIACLALGLGPGDWLWTSPNTFVASANCGLYCGAKVDFVDIDPRTYNLCPKALEDKLQVAERNGNLPKVVVPVHFSGQPCDMRSVHELSKKYGFRIIEDASHAIGGKYLNEPIGNCRYSDITVFSFHPVKIVTSAEGGMAVTNNDKLAEKVALLRSHGITRTPSLMTKPMEGSWYYQQVDLGFNYRMTDLQGALGASQMGRLVHYVARRHELAKRYDKLLKDLPVVTPWQDKNGYSAFHLYVIRLKLGEINTSHVDVFEALRAKEIIVNLHYIPVHTQPYYREMGFSDGDFPESEKYYSEAISIPLFPALTYDEQDFVVESLKEAMGL